MVLVRWLGLGSESGLLLLCYAREGVVGGGEGDVGFAFCGDLWTLFSVFLGRGRGRGKGLCVTMESSRCIFIWDVENLRW
jgi:hypothetical protein